jgi:hypothetical protein
MFVGFVSIAFQKMKIIHMINCVQKEFKEKKKICCANLKINFINSIILCNQQF